MSNVRTFKTKAQRDQEIKQANEESGSYMQGEARCNGCGHHWQAVLELSNKSEEFAGNRLECPECHAMKGVLLHHIGWSAGNYSIWTCEVCRSQLFSILAANDGSGVLIACSNCARTANAIDIFDAAGE